VLPATLCLSELVPFPRTKLRQTRNRQPPTLRICLIGGQRYLGVEIYRGCVWTEREGKGEETERCRHFCGRHPFLPRLRSADCRGSAGALETDSKPLSEAEFGVEGSERAALLKLVLTLIFVVTRQRFGILSQNWHHMTFHSTIRFPEAERDWHLW
jgi:hypothetical protein